MQSESNTINILVMAPILGADLGFLQGIDPRVKIVDGTAAYQAELEAQGLHSLGGLSVDADTRPSE